MIRHHTVRLSERISGSSHWVTHPLLSQDSPRYHALLSFECLPLLPKPYTQWLHPALSNSQVNTAHPFCSVCFPITCVKPLWLKYLICEVCYLRVVAVRYLEKHWRREGFVRLSVQGHSPTPWGDIWLHRVFSQGEQWVLKFSFLLFIWSKTTTHGRVPLTFRVSLLIYLRQPLTDVLRGLISREI